MSSLLSDLLNIFFALVLVLINGFFVAVEFALVKLREGRLNELVKNSNHWPRRLSGFNKDWMRLCPPANWALP